MTKVTQISLDEGDLNRRRIHLREISGDSDSSLETVGQDLRAARQRRGDDLAAVSRNLKIRKDHLEAIEEDRLEALPGRAYAVGFVRTYSGYLGLDPVQYVERFKTEIGSRGEPTRSVSLATVDERRLPQGWIIIALVVLGLVAYGAYHLAMSAESLLRPSVASVPAPLLPASHKQAAPAGRIIAQQPRHSAPAQLPDAAQKTTPESGKVQAAASSKVIQTTTPAAASQTTAQILAALPKGQLFGERNANPRVVLRARADVQVLVQDVSGRVYINRTLKPGDSYQVPDRVGLSLSTADGGAVGIELDGQAMGFAGKTGKMTEAMSLNPQAVFDRFNGASAQ